MPDDVTLGLIGGTGLADALLAAHPADAGKAIEIDTPFGPPSAPPVQIDVAGTRVLVIARHGVGHVLNPTQVPYRANIFALKQLGVTHILASGAVGSLRQELSPRDLVISSQVIDKTHRRPATFYEHAAVHVEMAEPFCPLLRQTLVEAAADLPETTVHDGGCYVCMEGPAFGTRAESLMHRIWGGDLIGMTLMPEAKLAREAEIAYAHVALVTDYDAWRVPGESQAEGGKPPADALLSEIIGNLKAASEAAVRLLTRAVERIAADPACVAGSPAREALKLAIWSDKGRVAKEEVERLAPLWVRYFDQGPA